MDPRDVQSIPLFAGLSKDDQKVVAQYADEVDVEAGKVLAQRGQARLRVLRHPRAARRTCTLDGRHAAALGPGDFFGEIGLLAGERRVATVVATSPMHLVVLTGSQLRAIDSRMPGVAERIRSAMAQRLAANRVASGRLGPGPRRPLRLAVRLAPGASCGRGHEESGLRRHASTTRHRRASVAGCACGEWRRQPTPARGRAAGWAGWGRSCSPRPRCSPRCTRRRRSCPSSAASSRWSRRRPASRCRWSSAPSP